MVVPEINQTQVSQERKIQDSVSGANAFKEDSPIKEALESPLNTTKDQARPVDDPNLQTIPEQRPSNFQGFTKFTDNRTGTTTGVQLPDGRLFLGVSEERVNELIENFNKDLPEGEKKAVRTTQDIELSNQVEELQRQQENRYQQFLQGLQPETRGDRAERFQRAGLSFADQTLLPLVGKKAESFENLTKLQKKAAYFLGILGTVGIKGFNASKILRLGNEIPNIRADITDKRTLSREILRAADQGGSIDNSIDHMNRLIDEAETNYAELVSAVAQSPTDIADGYTINNYYEREIGALYKRLERLEKLKIDRDYDDFHFYVQGLAAEDAAFNAEL